ncbi:hypothetical protein [Conchiformibius steedae]|uniref:hypothetical protein n=1 Tax=Conchiformibius steedae TaxID=153493 RepID=UPI0026EBA6FE|nr:hypothetical protein [Conchiformibius steedae]
MGAWLTLLASAAVLASAWHSRAWGFIAGVLAACVGLSGAAAWLFGGIGLQWLWQQPFLWLHVCVFAGALGLLIGNLENEDQGLWRIRRSNGFLSLLAWSSLLQHLGCILLAILIYLQYPAGGAPVLMVRLAQFYWFDPQTWWLMQAWLMGLFALHRCLVCRQSANVFGVWQLQAGFLLALLWQFVHISGLGVWLMWRWFS